MSNNNNNRFELDPERLSSTDVDGHRVYIYPEEVKGKWKTRRFLGYWFLVFLYLILPWIYINGKPSLKIDIFQREFTVLGSTLHGVEPILFFLLLVSGLFFIAFLTSVLGRVWCGWGCPQTVFIQAIFLKIESLIEGKSRERLALEQQPWNLNKFFKRTLKWGIFLIISSHIAHTFIGYFVGPKELFFMTMHSPSEHMGIFIATMILTSIFLLDFGWFREQFCIIACPYGRIQSVLMDENSKIVAYDTKRGEPRRGGVGINREAEGDCVNCYSCVKVCPTGIDIRRGTQLECIACTQCIDACDDIMNRLKRPQGLIRYTSEVELRGEKKKRNLRPYLYITLSLIFVSSFFYFLNASTHPELVFLRGVGSPFLVSDISQEIGGESFITNKFTLKIKHQGTDHFLVHLKFADPQMENQIHMQISENPIKLDTPEKKLFIFFKFKKDILISGSKTILINVINNDGGHLISQKEVTLVGPVE